MMVNINSKDIFEVYKYKVVITDQGSTVYLIKDMVHNEIDIQEFIEITKPVIKYLHEEGFLKKKSVKVAIVSSN